MLSRLVLWTEDEDGQGSGKVHGMELMAMIYGLFMRVAHPQICHIICKYGQRATKLITKLLPSN